MLTVKELMAKLANFDDNMVIAVSAFSSNEVCSWVSYKSPDDVEVRKMKDKNDWNADIEEDIRGKEVLLLI